MAQLLRLTMRCYAGRPTRLRAPRQQDAEAQSARVLAERVQPTTCTLASSGPGRLADSDCAWRAQKTPLCLVLCWRGKQAAGHCQTGEPESTSAPLARHSQGPHPATVCQDVRAVKPEPVPSTKTASIHGAIVLRHVPADASSHSCTDNVVPQGLHQFCGTRGGSQCHTTGTSPHATMPKVSAHISPARPMGQGVADGFTKREAQRPQSCTRSSCTPCLGRPLCSTDEPSLYLSEA